MDKKRTDMITDLLNWYDEKKRDLPWRKNPLPYYVWISEIMLQQTRVEAVKEYFYRFIKALPEIKDLAEAPEEKLLKLWEGLGYYNRAHNLKKAAVMVEEEYNGRLPQDEKELKKLPGIGSYTAGAISSIAYGRKAPAVDGNVLRVMKRMDASYDDITKGSVKKQLEEEILSIMPEDRPGDFNQALMELGAVVCIPNGKPLCEKCPVKRYCLAREKNIVMEIPVKPPKKTRKIEKKTVFVIEYQKKYAIHKREEKGLLAKLWELPNVENKWSIPTLEKWLDENGIEDYELELLGETKHIFSHIEWHMLGYAIRIQNIRDSADRKENKPIFFEEDLLWVTKEELKEKYALPAAFSKFCSSVSDNYLM